MDVATAATLGATAVTLAWFIRDMKRENTKVLKRIEEGQERQTETMMKGFSTLSEDSKTIAKVLERIENSQSRGFGTLERNQEAAAKILERIEGNTSRS